MNVYLHVFPNDILLLYFCVDQVFLFEGSITLLVPLQESVVAVIEDPTIITEEEYHLMKQPELMFPLVYNRTILCIITFYTIFGIFCWMAYGDSVNTVLTTSLPIGGLATSVQLAYSIAVMLTFPLQNFPALEIITRSILAWASNYRSCSVPTLCNNKWISGSYSELSKERRKQRHRNIISSCTVLLLALVAVFTMESLDKVVSLMGSLFGCPIAYVIPPMIHTRLVLNQQEHSGTEKERSYRRYRLYCNYLAIAFGLIAMIMASITTLLTWK